MIYNRLSQIKWNYMEWTNGWTDWLLASGVVLKDVQTGCKKYLKLIFKFPNELIFVEKKLEHFLDSGSSTLFFYYFSCKRGNGIQFNSVLKQMQEIQTTQVAMQLCTIDFMYRIVKNK